MRSFAFQDNQIHEDSSTCTRCKKLILNIPFRSNHVYCNNDAIRWSQCNHVYCSSCVLGLIAHHLHVFNAIPTCIHSKCDQPLNMNDIPLYSTTSLHEYTKHKMLIEGYMRYMRLFIPSSIASLVSDYHHNNLHKPTPCVECKDFLRVPISKSSSNEQSISVWYLPPRHMSLEDVQRLNIGDLIDYRDEMGRFRHAVVIDKQGTNLRIHYESDTYPMFKCLVDDKWSDFSVLSELRRFAKYDSLTKRPCDRKEFKFNNKYHPRNSIMHWTNCHHVVCVDCLLPYAEDCVTRRELPICPDVNCEQEIGGNNFNFIYYHNKNFIICTDLKTLFDEKYRKCELCQDYTSNETLREWGLCRHKYHISCAKRYIDSWLPQKRGFIAGIFCKNKVPLCVNKDCGSFLDDKCAEMFHITRYQMRMLNELRNEITYNFDEEWVQINFKDVEGFKASG